MQHTTPRPSSRRWPPARRAAWLALFWAIFGWAALVDPAPGVSAEPLPVVGWVGA
jgi:hypothetical protein